MAFAELIKLGVKQKAHFRCCICQRDSVSLEIHHIVPLADGGADTEDNAAPLCPTCHEEYGANPSKRKAIREARDFWYQVCEKRFAPNPEKLDEIAFGVEQLVEFQEYLAERLNQNTGGSALYRSEMQILETLEELFDVIWYNRHMYHKAEIDEGLVTVDPGVWKIALEAAQRKRDEYGEENLGPWSDFEWGMLNGKMSALRWIMGDEWDFLDT